jgi:hypothetical protein
MSVGDTVDLRELFSLERLIGYQVFGTTTDVIQYEDGIVTALKPGRQSVALVNNMTGSTKSCIFVVEECTHSDRETINQKDAGCTTAGYTGDVYCKTCGEMVSAGSQIDATGHQYGDWLVAKEATETADGLKVRICSVCKDTETEIIPKKEAATETTPETEPTRETEKPSSAEQKELQEQLKNIHISLEEGASISDSTSGGTYKVTLVGRSGYAEVAYTGPANKKQSTVVIPDVIVNNGVRYKVTSITANAFKNNKYLKKVTIGSNIVSIGNKAFYKCQKLTAISIPASVVQIGKQTFFGCKKLKKITIQTKQLTKSSVGSNAFKGIYATATIKVPKALLKTYKKLLVSKGVGSKAKFKK